VFLEVLELLPGVWFLGPGATLWFIVQGATKVLSTAAAPFSIPSSVSILRILQTPQVI
jgi:hypothetical protein